MRKPKIVVTYIEAGMGHIVSAKAISDAIKRKYGDQVDVCDLYLAKESPVLEKYQNMLIKEVKRSNKMPGYGNFQFFCMKAFGKTTSLRFTHNTVFINAKKEMLKVIGKKRPDVVINTHYSPHHCSVELRNNYLKNLLVATYDPDPNVHGWWDNRSDLFFVNNEYAKEQALKDSKFKKESVKQVGFTARENILNCNLSKDECREKYNLPKENFTVILADGAYATSKLKEFTDEFCKITKPVTLIVIAGKNNKVKEYFENKLPTLPQNITMKVFGFVDNIQELYKASDIFVTKGGPNAIQDSVFLGTPVLVNYYAQPIEKFTQYLFTKKYNCGETIKNKAKARKQVEKWIDNPELLKPYVENCHKLDNRKTGADEIADKIIENLKKRKPYLFN